MRIEESSREGMERALAKLETATRSLSASNRNPTQPLEDTVDLSGAAVVLIKSRSQFEASVKAFQAADEMSKKIVDLKA